MKRRQRKGSGRKDKNFEPVLVGSIERGPVERMGMGLLSVESYQKGYGSAETKEKEVKPLPFVPLFVAAGSGMGFILSNNEYRLGPAISQLTSEGASKLEVMATSASPSLAAAQEIISGLKAQKGIGLEPPDGLSYTFPLISMEKAAAPLEGLAKDYSVRDLRTVLGESSRELRSLSLSADRDAQIGTYGMLLFATVPLVYATVKVSNWFRTRKS